ncbi:MAG TPA: hypothetical protein DD738_02490 [Ruminiclostridium sp.]|nr:hypothetical protein [Ruminiclostridium sp.]
MAKFCIKCGAALREGAKFCSGCGTPVQAKQKMKKTQQESCIKCGVPLKKGAKFCIKCGEPIATGEKAAVDIPVNEPVVSVTVSDQPPVMQEKLKEAKKQVSNTVKNKAAGLGKKALSKLLNQTLSASETAGEMRIPMTEAQKSCLTDVIRELTKMVGR